MRRAATLLFLVCLLFDSVGQSDHSATDSDTRLGFYFSGNLSYLTANNIEGPTVRYLKEPGAGYKAGVTIHHGLSSRFTLETSLGYVFERSNYRFERWGGNPSAMVAYSEAHSTYSWLEVPLSLNYAFWRRDKVSYFAGIGLSVRKLLKASTDVSVLLGNGFTFNSSLNSGVNEWNFFPTIQAGCHFELSDNSRLTVLASYQQSISSWYQTSGIPPGADSHYGNPDFVQHCINLGVVYSVNLKSLK
ncbi:MAG: outer membrane beta-barrel protein [Cyclobacteriaceae bacterium]|nr:outer membrane beta-barrel protein [Cyclobacteriaceae bacterium]